MKRFKEKEDEFEELLEENDTKTAIKKYYKRNGKRISIGAASLAIVFALTLAPFSPWVKGVIVIALALLNVIYGRYKNG